MISIILSRSLTGVFSLIIAFSITSFLWIIKNKKLDIFHVLPIFLILILSFLSDGIGYKFPALDPTMCPPQSADKCNCSLYSDNLDTAKNSESVVTSIYSRMALITNQGVEGFGNTSTLGEYILQENFQIIGQGLGMSNLLFSPKFDDLTKKVKNGEVSYRNPGRIVSFNNLYVNFYFSVGIIGLVWFLIIMIKILGKLYLIESRSSFYVFTNLILIFIMFFFQAEEFSTMLGINIGLVLLENRNEKV